MSTYTSSHLCNQPGKRLVWENDGKTTLIGAEFSLNFSYDLLVAATATMFKWDGDNVQVGPLDWNGENLGRTSFSCGEISHNMRMCNYVCLAVVYSDCHSLVGTH